MLECLDDGETIARPGQLSRNVPSRNSIDRHVGGQVRLLRKRQKLTGEELSKIIDVPAATLLSYERGTKRIGVLHLFALAKALKVNLGAFYEGLSDHGIASAPTERGALSAEEQRFLLQIQRLVPAQKQPQALAAMKALLGIAS